MMARRHLINHWSAYALDSFDCDGGADSGALVGYDLIGCEWFAFTEACDRAGGGVEALTVLQ